MKNQSTSKLSRKGALKQQHGLESSNNVEQQFEAVELQCEGLNNNANSRITYEESNNNVRRPTRTQKVE
jgi:hypothetical protein